MEELRKELEDLKATRKQLLYEYSDTEIDSEEERIADEKWDEVCRKIRETRKKIYALEDEE